jgi:glycerol kinase
MRYLRWLLSYYPGNITYALEGSSFIAGAAIQFIRDNLSLLTDSKSSASIAQNVSAAPALYFVPALSGLGAPHWNAASRGAFMGLTRSTSKSQLIRATLEGIALQVNDLLTAFQKDAKVPFSVMRVDGGAAANDLLMNIQAQLSGIILERPTNVESTAIGAAMFAALGVGIYRDFEQIIAVGEIEARFTPQSDIISQEKTRAILLGWERALGAVRLFAQDT